MCNTPGHTPSPQHASLIIISCPILNFKKGKKNKRPSIHGHSHCECAHYVNHNKSINNNPGNFFNFIPHIAMIFVCSFLFFSGFYLFGKLIQSNIHINFVSTLHWTLINLLHKNILLIISIF